MSDPMAEIRASFFIECEELLESLFDALQSMSDGDSDGETINIAFRAVHSIKGGAGAFALEELVDFAHHFETVMDDLRSGRLDVDPTLIDLFFRCGDILTDLVRAAREETPADRASIDPVIDALKAAAADDVAKGDTPTDDSAVAAFTPLTLNLGDLSLSTSGDDFFETEVDVETGRKDGLEIIFRPEPELYASGNEPLYLLRNLADLGPTSVRLNYTPTDDAPATLTPSDALAWQIFVETDAPRQAVEEIFEFVTGLCTLEIKDAKTSASEAPDDLTAPLIEPDQNAMPTASDATVPEPLDFPPTKPGAPVTQSSASQRSTPSPTVRVDLERVDRLVNLVGELVINQSMLSQSVVEAQIPSNSAVSAGLEEFLQLTRDIQESVMMIRAQPVKSLFQRMSRIVREASAAVEKKVTLTTEGEATEIDKTVIERLADPLTHMIRNAVGHGLETSEKRRALGKPETGNVRLSAMHKSGRVVIEVADDGGGINRPKVFDIAVQKGLIPTSAQLSDSEIDQLLFMPGFSTADQVSNLSGRGVGMDVVKNAITSLGGTIATRSRPGEGTTFSISLPLTLAVQDGMVVTVAKETLVMPLSAILETLTVQNDDIRRIGPRTNVVLVRDTFVPLLDLGVELGYRAPLDDYTNAIALLVGQNDGSTAALIVDAIEDQRQVVIKGLEESYGRVAGVAAATILGDGQVALILDAADLVQNAIGHSRAQNLKEVV